MSPKKLKRPGARERLVETAERLFYAEGIRAVGIDRIIAEAGVAKMSLYNHFDSKDDLILAVLEYREQKFDAMYESSMAKHAKAGRQPLEAFFGALKDWFKSPGFRGCMFINSFVELADANHAGAVFSSEHKKRFHASLANAIAESHGKQTAKERTPQIALLVEGAIITAALSGSPKPADHAKNAAIKLLS
ncbi:TetR/AcrR family transcriptional regulator [Roseiconus lacunae]|uniref:TetR/AcrR family transcriptional regulator n=1 Tax=Roseiconus lacunae TaxID=2605694 RepID=UPI001E54EFC0|nr:TetR/AcrR family transcriptional regulator [Roseiconus lacunae]MCD0463298.1 TetR/AcrR family transcriptional regulator [Roseiconus lacunae]